MSQLEDIIYSRAATVAAVGDYYEFLVKMYMHDSQVVYPPCSGWPSIINADPEALKVFGKSDEVLALLAHLPYIRGPENWHDDADAIPMCSFADWVLLVDLVTPDPTDDFVRVRTEGDIGRLVYPHIVGLVTGRWDDTKMVLDTEHGVIYWMECPWEILEEYGESTVIHDDLDDMDEKEVEWREDAAAWIIPEFFEILKDQFRKLHWVPISPRTVRNLGSLGLNNEDKLAKLQGVYRQHGWPDLAVYDKTKCLEAVDRALAESYPDETCLRPRGRLTPDPATYGAEATPAAIR